jgi:hypothetical protein
MTNASNPVSPVSPINPVMQQTPAPVPQVQAVISNPVASPVMNSTTTVAPTVQTTQTAPQPSPMQKKSATALGRVLLLEQKQLIKQNNNPFPIANINQEIPLEIRQNNKFLLDILSSGSITGSVTINQITKDTVEYEQ